MIPTQLHWHCIGITEAIRVTVKEKNLAQETLRVTLLLFPLETFLFSHDLIQGPLNPMEQFPFMSLGFGSGPWWDCLWKVVQNGAIVHNSSGWYWTNQNAGEVCSLIADKHSFNLSRESGYNVRLEDVSQRWSVFCWHIGCGGIRTAPREALVW